MAISESPKPQPGESTTDSLGSPIIIFDGPGDTTRRPADPKLPNYFPGRTPPEGYPKSKPKPPSPPSGEGR
jgi:hypothetical protein